MNERSKTPNEFVLLVDKDGDAVDLLPLNDDDIWACARNWDVNFPDSSHHLPIFWNGKEWRMW